MDETADLISTSATTKRLMESNAQDKAGKTTIREVKVDWAKPKIRSRKTSKTKASR